ncbi:MAG: RNA-binding cell elongation regulator Jag/EloR [Thermodesulfobacteriota bacterium]|nr:RNA-binding cell elongation regulator Jag/EloR [Thermodesulfobacteriota bacterium]
MKDAIEIEGKTIDEAIQKACMEFNVSREKLNIEILSEGSPGFLGFVGGSKAFIKASLLSIDIDMDSSLGERTEGDAESYDISLNDSLGKRSRKDKELTEEIVLEAKTFIEGLLSHIGLDFPVNAEANGDYTVLNIQGDGGGLLIGKGGQTLDAMQYLTNKMLNKNGGARSRIILDTENYRKKREKNLIFLAEKLGGKVKRTGRSVTVNPMNAHDRRTIHIALQDDRDLITRSRGEGTFRKIVILPNKGGKTKS